MTEQQTEQQTEVKAEANQEHNEDWSLFGKEELFRKALAGLRTDGHSTTVASPLDNEILQQVRTIEEQATSPQAPAALASAGGDDIEKLALLDKLTELLNTRTFIKELKDELKRAKRYKRPVSLAMISIDNIGELGGQHGPLTENAVLRVTSGVIREVVRETDLAARYGQNEIAIIFPETPASEAALIMEGIRYRIGTQAITHNWEQLRITASAGLAAFPAHATEHDELTARALQALQVAQARGGDRVCSV